MTPSRFSAALPVLLTCLCAGAAWAASVTLQIGDPGDPDSLPLRNDPAAIHPSSPEAWLVYGRLAMPDFSVPGIDRVRLQDAEGRAIPLLVESNTLYREFGEIAGMRIAFELDPRALAAGLPVLAWGPDVAASNRALPELVFSTDSAARIRSFTVQKPAPGGAEAARFATIEIIADSHADRYYLWYLLPMVMILALLVVRKRWNL